MGYFDKVREISCEDRENEFALDPPESRLRAAISNRPQWCASSFEQFSKCSQDVIGGFDGHDGA